MVIPDIALGDAIPPDTSHAVSVSLPTWNANIGYEEGEQWVLSRMTNGYPRFFIHKSIVAFARDVAEKHGRPDHQAMLFATPAAAARCLAFVRQRRPAGGLEQPDASTVHLRLDPSMPCGEPLRTINPTISAVICTAEAFVFAKQYWQHTGDGISSRRAEFCHRLFQDGFLVDDALVSGKACRGPRRYQRRTASDGTNTGPARGQPAGPDIDETHRFVEERFGRNLDLSLLERATSAIKRRIAGALAGDADADERKAPDAGSVLLPNTRGVSGLREDDIYLYPCGMNAIFHSHRYLLEARGSLKSVSFGFPYVDTLKILQKFGPGCIFYGHASADELDDLERRLRDGERFLALFCEFPGNPLLTCPDLVRIRHLADTYDFAVVIDETIGTFANINVLPFADMVVSSLTKIFSGDCNVMGGSAILNPAGRYYSALKSAATAGFEGAYWPEDVIFMERNSRDFAPRVARINANAEAICDVLAASSLVKKVYYPKLGRDVAHFEVCRLPSGGYGGLLSVAFHAKRHAVAFYDAIKTAKGPSLGTNFTLTSPYVVLAHYQELEWAASLGVDPDLIRISVGLEGTEDLTSIFSEALEAAQRASDE